MERYYLLEYIFVLLRTKYVPDVIVVSFETPYCTIVLSCFIV